MDSKTKKKIEEKDPNNMLNDKVKEALEQDVINYLFGDLILSCSNCGADTILDRNIRGGISFNPLAADSRSHFGLGCSNCKTSLLLRYQDAEFKPAYGFNYNGYNIPKDGVLTWKASDNVENFKVSITKEDNKTLAEGEQPELDWSETITEKAEFQLDLEENESYLVQVSVSYKDHEEDIPAVEIVRLSAGDEPSVEIVNSLNAPVPGDPVSEIEEVVEEEV